MGLFSNDTHQQTGIGMNLGMTGAPNYGGFNGATAGMGVGVGLPAAQYTPQQQNGFMGGMMGGMGASQQQQQMMQNGQFAPPNETDILVHLLNSSVPVEKWLSGNNFQNVVSMLSNVVTLCLHNYLKNAKFVADEEGNLTIDVTSLPQDIQTTSVENVTMELQKVQSSAQQSVQMSQMQQQQIMAMAQQSMMGGAMAAAMADPGMVSKAGGAVGGFARSLIGLPQAQRGGMM